MLLLGALSALLIASLLAAAVCAWLLAGRAAWWSASGSRRRPGADAAFQRHPASRGREFDPALLFPRDPAAPPGAARPAGPDDDPDFIEALERLIRGEDRDGS